MMQSLFGTFWDSAEPTATNLSDPTVLTVGNTIKAVLQHVPTQVRIPQMVTVGSQSSGKSSVINNILSMDLLPTGKNMVTRTPLRLELLQTETTDGRVEFGGYSEEAAWVVEYSVTITLPVPNGKEIGRIREKIEQLTIQYAGQGQNITDREIHIRLYSPHVPNLTLVDLPGLTQVACTDRGQPKDIKEKILSLVTRYIEKPETIILAVMQARTDMEADLSLSLVKQHDRKCERTLGILTKVDLMEEEADISPYLRGEISVDLKLNYGYFAVRNRSSAEAKTHSIIEGFQLEKEYFLNHPKYKKQARCGISYLANSLTGILVDKVRGSIPGLSQELQQLEAELVKKLQALGDPLPDTPEAQRQMVQKILMKFTQQFTESLESRGASLNTGRMIKETFIEFRGKLGNILPFDKTTCTDEFIQTMLKNCEGNHMSFLAPPIEVLEACLMNSKHNPYLKFVEPTFACIGEIKSHLLKLGQWVLNDLHVHRFPTLNRHIRQVITKTITDYEEETVKLTQDLVDMEQSYIWTDEKEFLAAVELNNQNPVDLMRMMMSTYFSIITTKMQHIIPKAVMWALVRKVENTLSEQLFVDLHKQDIAALVQERQEQGSTRQRITTELRSVQNARRQLEQILE